MLKVFSALYWHGFTVWYTKLPAGIYYPLILVLLGSLIIDMSEKMYMQFTSMGRRHKNMTIRYSKGEHNYVQAIYHVYILI